MMKGGRFSTHTYFVVGSVGATMRVLLTFTTYFCDMWCVCIHMYVLCAG